MRILAILNLPRLSSPPAAPQAGWVYYDTGLSKVRFYDGSGWINTV